MSNLYTRAVQGLDKTNSVFAILNNMILYDVNLFSEKGAFGKQCKLIGCCSVWFLLDFTRPSLQAMTTHLITTYRMQAFQLMHTSLVGEALYCVQNKYAQRDPKQNARLPMKMASIGRYLYLYISRPKPWL